jgi:hypothetical protein
LRVVGIIKRFFVLTEIRFRSLEKVFRSVRCPQIPQNKNEGEEKKSYHWCVVKVFQCDSEYWVYLGGEHTHERGETQPEERDPSEGL